MAGPNKLYQSVIPLKKDVTNVYTKDKIEPIMNKTNYPTDLFNTNKVQYVDSVLTAHKDKEWIQRFYDKNAMTLQTNKIKGFENEPDSEISTHLMSDDGNGYVYPTIIKQGEKLIHFPSELNLNEEQSIEYARKNNIGIQLPKEQGTWFARNGYKQGTNILKLQ